jgi:hypothetical protein
MGIGPFFCGHALLCALPIIAATALRSCPTAFGAYLQLALWTAIAGPFGTPVAMLAAAFGESRVPSSQDIGAWLDDQVATWLRKTRDLQSALLDRRIRIEGASQAAPLRDAFAVGSQQEKFAALTVIARKFDPSLAYALRLAMRDTDPSVRVLASTVIAKLQTRMSARLAALKDTAAKEDAPEAWLALGQAHAKYATSGLLLAFQSHQHLALAVNYTGEALARSPQPDVIRHQHDEILAEWRQHARALEPAAVHENFTEQPNTATAEAEASEITLVPLRQGADRASGALS